MVKFKHKNGGIAEVFTDVNIKRLRNDKNYTEILGNAQAKEEDTPKKNKVKEEVVENKPLQ